MHVQVTWGTYPVQSIVAVPQVHPIQLTSNKTQMQTTLAYSHQWTNLVKCYGIVTFGCIAWQTLLQMFLVPSTSHANHHVNALHSSAMQLSAFLQSVLWVHRIQMISNAIQVNTPLHGMCAACLNHSVTMWISM